MRLEVRQLGKRFDSGRWGLRGVDLVLDGPGLTLLSGHNGSGKTLLARHLLGLEQPDEGEVLLDGADIRKDLRGLRRRVAFVFQEPEHQILGMTVDEDVAWTPSRLGWPAARIQASAIFPSAPPFLPSATVFAGMSGRLLDSPNNQAIRITNAGFKNSDGWILTPRITSQRRAPLISAPK